MSNEPLASNKCGCCVLSVYLFVILLIVLAVFWVPISGWFKAQRDQVVAVQTYRTEFALKCVRQKGHTIRLSKASVSVMCIGQDGRILSSY